MIIDWNKYCEIMSFNLNRLTFSLEIVQILKNSVEKNQNIFVAGNGGSATIAEHFTCDLSKCLIKSQSKTQNRYKVINLVSNLSYITAISNDKNYDKIFSEQLTNLADEDDILILISASGNSKNIINALDFAINNNMTAIGVTGFDGGILRQQCDYSVHLDCDDYGIVENIHQIFCHFIADLLK